MPPSPTARTTLYRLTNVAALGDTIRAKYRDHESFESSEIIVAGQPAVLCQGSMQSERTEWADRLEKLSGIDVTLGNRTAAAALVVADPEHDDVAWALTYGMGFQLLHQDYVDAGFGQRVVVRTADPETLRSLTRTTLDHRARTDRSSIPAGEALRGFGMGEFGEIVSRLVGPAHIDGLSDPKGTVTVRGADALNLPLAKDPLTLLADLGAIRAVLSTEPLPELEALEQLTALKRPDVIRSLDEHLDEALKDGDDRLAVGWPFERIDENGTPTRHRYSGVGHADAGPHDDVPTIDDLRAVLDVHATDDRVAALKTIKLQMLGDDDGAALSPEIPLRQWLAYEKELDGKRYCLHNGRWYLMDENYATRLDARVADVFARDPEVALPPWTPGIGDEGAYNVSVAPKLGGVSLDKKLIHTTAHPRGFEPCDIVLPNGTLVHVKSLTKSAAASHLVAQALVSAEALLYDNEAREKLRQRVDDAGGDPEWIGIRPHSIVLGMAREVPPTSASLFTFTKVTVARLDSVLGSSGVSLAVAPIAKPHA